MKVAAIQMVSSFDVEENLAVADELITQAVDEGAKFVALPENFAFMGQVETDKLTVKESYGKGPIQKFLSERALQYKIYLLGGTVPLAADSEEHVRSASLLYDMHGECIARYDKIHLFDVYVSDEEVHKESTTVEPGTALIVAQASLAKLGLSVCYDLRFPELYRHLSSSGAEVMTVPSAFTQVTGQAHWEILLKARAIENLCYVIAPNQGGVHANGRETFGHSMIIDYWGNVLASIDKGPGVITADIDLKQMYYRRQTFPSTEHRKV